MGVPAVGALGTVGPRDRSTAARTIARLTVPSTISASGASPITVAANVPAGARVARIRVFKLSGTTRDRGASRTTHRTLIATVYRRTPTARRCTFRLTEEKLRRLKAGRYAIEVRVGPTRADLGPATTRNVTVGGGEGACVVRNTPALAHP